MLISFADAGSVRRNTFAERRFDVIDTLAVADYPDAQYERYCPHLYVPL
jgi:hypothetical protein